MLLISQDPHRTDNHIGFRHCWVKLMNQHGFPAGDSSYWVRWEIAPLYIWLNSSINCRWKKPHINRMRLALLNDVCQWIITTQSWILYYLLAIVGNTNRLKLTKPLASVNKQLYMYCKEHSLWMSKTTPVQPNLLHLNVLHVEKCQDNLFILSQFLQRLKQNLQKCN